MFRVMHSERKNLDKRLYVPDDRTVADFLRKLFFCIVYRSLCKADQLVRRLCRTSDIFLLLWLRGDAARQRGTGSEIRSQKADADWRCAMLFCMPGA